MIKNIKSKLLYTNISIIFLSSIILLAYCNQKKIAIVKAKECLQVRVSPCQKSKRLTCLRNNTEVEVYGVDKSGVIINGKKGNYVIISYYDDEGNKKVGYVFDAHLVYPVSRISKIIFLVFIFLILISILFLIRYLFKKRKSKTVKDSNRVSDEEKVSTDDSTGLNIKKKYLFKIVTLIIFCIFILFLLIKNIDFIKNIFSSRILGTSLNQVKKNNLRGYVSKYVRAMDSINPTTRDFACKLASKYPGKYSVQQICSIYDYVRSEWKYVNDPKGMEYISSASRTIKNGLIGDCDDYAILLASLIKSIGGESRIIFAVGKDSAHAYAEVKIKLTDKTLEYFNQHYRNTAEKLFDINRIKELHTHKGYNGEWFNLDWTSKIPGGKYFKSTYNIIIYPNGYFVERKKLKEYIFYLQPAK